MSKFNKIYEYEYFLFGQVSKGGEIFPNSPSMSALIRFCDFCCTECDGNHDICVGSLTGSGVQSSFSEMVSLMKNVSIFVINVNLTCFFLSL